MLDPGPGWGQAGFGAPRSVPIPPAAGAGGGSGARTLPQVPTSPAQPRDAQMPLATAPSPRRRKGAGGNRTEPPGAPPGGCLHAWVGAPPGPSDPMCVLFKGPFMFLLYTINWLLLWEPVAAAWWLCIASVRGCFRSASCRGPPGDPPATRKGRGHPRHPVSGLCQCLELVLAETGHPGAPGNPTHALN